MQQTARLNSIVATAQKMNSLTEKEPANKGSKRLRRSTADAAIMKGQIRAARTRGVPAAKLAEKYGVSTAYIYMIE